MPTLQSGEVAVKANLLNSCFQVIAQVAGARFRLVTRCQLHPN